MMGSRSLWLLLSLVATASAYSQYPQWQQQQLEIQPSCPGNLPLSKLMFNQSDYIQYVHYFTEIPNIASFTIQYWFNLIDTNRTSTMFDYTRTEGETKNSIIIQLEHGYVQRWNILINDEKVISVFSPTVKAGEWHHMVHSWDSQTGWASVYMDGNILDSRRSSVGRGVVIPGGGFATSGQRQNTLHDGMDRREGLEGWFTLFQMSSSPLVNPLGSETRSLVSRLASQCSGQAQGDVISWTRTPRKGYGGIMETPSSQVCRHF